jgi:hypothetical protein
MTNTEFSAEAVDLGRRLVRDLGDRKWELGDLANRVCPATNGDKGGRLLRFAAEIDIDIATLASYRTVAVAWPLSTRAESSWTVHRELASNPDRFEIIAEQPIDQNGEVVTTWTLRGIRRRLQRDPFDQPIPPSPVEPTDDPDDLIDPEPPMPGPWDALVEGRRLAGSIDADRATFRSLQHRAADDPETLRLIVTAVRASLEGFLDLVKVAEMELDGSLR